MCRLTPHPEPKYILTAFPALAKVIMENDGEDILIDLCWAFSYISEMGDPI
jgi:hypothetical protein